MAVTALRGFPHLTGLLFFVIRSRPGDTAFSPLALAVYSPAGDAENNPDCSEQLHCPGQGIVGSPGGPLTWLPHRGEQTSPRRRD